MSGIMQKAKQKENKLNRQNHNNYSVLLHSLSTFSVTVK